MTMSLRLGFIVSVLLASATEPRAQQIAWNDGPAEFLPLRPETRADLDRREARKLYALGLLRQRQDRLLDALRNLEDAVQLDPEAAAPHRALIPLYLALGRTDDALAACRATLDRDPGDHETWYRYARELREVGRSKESVAALRRAVACPSAKEHLEVLVQMHYDLAVLYEEAKDFGRAETTFGEVVRILVDRRQALIDSGFSPEQLDAEAAKTYERLGHVCIQAGSHDRAVSAFVQAQKRDPERADRLSYNLAEVCLAQRKPAAALTHLDRYLRTQPQGAQAYEMKIGILQELGRERDVLPSLRQAAERDLRNMPLQLLLARQSGRERLWAEAERRYLKLAEENPAADVYRGLFALYQEQAKAQGPTVMRRAVDVLDQALTAAEPKDDTQPGDASSAARARAMLAVLREDRDTVKALLRQAIGDLQAKRERGYTTWRLLGALAARTNQLDEAEKLYRECLGRITAQTEAEVYGGLLDVLSEARKHEEIVKFCQERRDKAQATNRIIFSIKLAPALLQLGKTEAALAEADEAVKLADDRNRLRVRRFRVSILAQAEHYEKASADCRALLKEYNQPGDVRDIRYTLSNVYSLAHEYARAEEQLRLIIEADPSDASAYNDLGYIMADQGKNLEESEQFIRKALDLDRDEKKAGRDVRIEGDSDNPAYLDSLGWVLFRRGKLDEARTWLEKAVALPGGDDPVLWDHLGDVYARQKEPARARAAWEKAVVLYEKEKRRRADDRYKEIKQKLQAYEKQTNQR